MQIQHSNHSLELPEGIRGKLIGFRRRVWLVKLTEGLLAAAVGLFLSYLLAFVLDRFGDTPAWTRALILVAGAIGLGVWFPLKWHRWVWRSRRLDQVARLVGHSLPRLGDQLLGIVELVQSDLDPGRSEALCRAALKQVDDEASQHDFADAVPNPQHRWWAWAASVPLAAVLAALLLTPAAGGNALARWLMPWKPTERYTFAQLEALPARMVVPYAEPFSVTAMLSKFTAWTPPQASARYGRQDEIRAELHAHGYTFSLPPQKEADWLRVSVGDAIRTVEVRPMTRPELTSMTARVKLPDYLQHASELTKDVRGGSVSLLRGSQVTFLARATRELSEATVDGIRQPIYGDNRLVTSPLAVTESTVRRFSWQDHLGLTAKEPFELSVRAEDDEPPTIACTGLSHEPVVLDGEVFSFQALATDDFGLKQIGLQWTGMEDRVGNPLPAKGEKLISGGGPDQRRLEVAATFSAQRDGVPPQSLQLRLFTVDYLPGRQRVYSPPYTLHVLSSEQHAIWLTSQLREWFRQAQELYEHEQRLHETNKQLRSLSAEEIDLAENRRRIMAQATAERDSAGRLETLATSGQQLVAQATRNEQFNVTTLETWAQMLQAIRDIAHDRMPPVANLLQAAADAPGSQTMADANRNARDPNAPQPGPQVGIDRDRRSGGAAGSPPTDPSTMPSVVDVESSFNDLDQDQPPEPSPAGSSPGGLSLPTTIVQGGGRPPSKPSRSNPAQQKVKRAVQQQQDLLADLARAAEELRTILSNLEGSTFVKRLKAASRRQLEVARTVNQNLLGGFGLGKEEVDQQSRRQLATIAEQETAYSDEVYVIQDDLDAYYNRVQQGKFKTVVNEMKDMQVVSRLRDIAHSAGENLNGQSIAQAEFWADSLDRWAEQLVGPG